jgi:hypothetical protein
MKQLILILIVIILLSSLIQTNSGKSSDIFIDHLSNLMWVDCKGKDIHINQPIINIPATNQSVSLIKWPYSKETLRRVTQLLGETPYKTYIGQCDGAYSMVSDTGWEGCGILTCGNNKLNINFDTYYWNGVKVDVPKEEFKTTLGNNSPIIETGDKSPVTTGDKSPITTGDSSPIAQQEWNIAFVQGTVFGTILGIILKILYDYIGPKYQKKKL